MKFTEEDVPPPGFGLETVTEIVPPVATSEERTPTARVVELEYPVGRGDPLKFTTDPGTKPLPVRTMSAPGGKDPIDVVDGLIAVNFGAGFEAGPTGNFTEGDATPGVLVCTAMLLSDSDARLSEPIVAVSCVTGDPTAVVFNAVPLNAIT